ncbi:prolyl-tRNA synthetase associated domain-containing protein [Bradyrhizobium sp.]|uniref:prolyl-tRNA synthetase associated domain-containing protein n=1 Tax=Bradyrhizobium sp. TaxID=376 RepID=UPI003C536058
MTQAAEEDLLNLLDAHGIAVAMHRHPPVHTVEESRTLRGEIAGAHTKNLFVRDSKKRFFLLVLDEDRKVNLKALAARIGARGGLSFGSAEALYEKLGIRPGSVSVFALINDKAGDVTVVLDEELRKAATINGHPLGNEATICVSPDGIDRFLIAVDHPAQWLDLATAE